jgi:polyamine oxidase
MSKLYDVIIVGAGVAGLSAARDIKSAGMSVLVLESSHRIGGRVYTDYSTGKPVELGAEFVHGDQRLSTWPLYKSAGMKLTPQAKVKVLLLDDGSVVSDKDSQYLDDFYAEFEKANIDDGTSVGSFIDKTAFNKSAKRIIHNQVGDYESTDSHKVGATYFQDGMKIDNGSNHLPVDGYSKLIDFLANGLDIKTNEKVECIDYSDPNNCIVRTPMAEYSATKVVCTVSLGVLKAGFIKFVPALPDVKKHTIQKFGMGQIVKVVIEFIDTILGDITIANNDDLISCFWRSAGDPRVLIAYVGGSRAETLSSMNDADAVLTFIKTLEKFGEIELMKKIKSSKVIRWDITNPHFMGAYSYGSVTSNQQDRITLARPINNKLYFAGEACNTNLNAAMVHGAIETGITVAREIVNL